MRKYAVLIIILFLFLSFPLDAKDKKVEFDAQAAWGYVKDMAANSMEGRRSGQPGGVMGEEYVAAKFKEWGLEPAGDNGTYFQGFTIEHRHVGQGVTLEVMTDRAKRDFYYGEDWRVQNYSGSGHFTANIVFVGYGIHAPDKGYDDYEGIDIQGKVALVSIGSSPGLSKKVGDAASMDKRIEAAQKLGARGVMLYRPATSTTGRFWMRVDKKLYNPDFVMVSIEDNVLDFIFDDLPTQDNTLFSQIHLHSKPKSFDTGIKAYISVNALFDEKRATRNVLAKISGSDKKLKEESIVIGGHMDHLGITPMGEVMNGANDNASGTAVVMELARIMKLNNAKPKRTVVFAAWAGEEQGLLGSRYYADNPTMPIEKTVMNINMDMVGHGSGKIPFNGVYYGPQIWEVLKEKLPKEILDTATPGRGGPGGSDHTPFLQKGVPAFFLITRGAIKYHHHRDDSDLIKPDMLKKTGDLVHASVKIIADEKGDLIQPRRQETYQIKYQNIINYEMPPLNKLIDNHGDTKDSHVKLQLSVIEEKEGLSGDDLRVDIINNLFEIPDKLNKTKGLSAYQSSSRMRAITRMGKTTVIVGLQGIKAFEDNPQWAEILAKQGLYFVSIEEPAFLFSDEGLSAKGKEILKTIQSSGLLLVVKGMDADQSRVLLEGSKKPLVFLQNDIPDKEIMDLVKEKEAAVGLILGADEDAASYVNKVKAVKEAIGTQYVMMVNEQCLWGSPGKTQMLDVISELLKVELGRGGLPNIFSGTFFRVLNSARTSGQ